MATNTSCSVFVSNNVMTADNEIFHLLIDAGEGVSNSLEVMDISNPKVDSIVSEFTKNPKKKIIFKDDILIIRRDTDRLRGYLRENFAPISVSNFD